jgi:hypothetical protein
MRAIHFLMSMAGLALPAFAQGPDAASSITAREPLLHASTSFDLVVHAPYAQTAPLFGPEGERKWAGKHWNPDFIHPQPAADVEGAVFTIQHGAFKAVWVTTLFDVEARHFQYVYVLPEIVVTVIDVRFNPVSENVTGVSVVYARTAITKDGNEHVAKMTEGDQSSGSEWQKAIDEYLAGEKTNARH